MIKNLITNWKTTGIGLSSIFGSGVHLIYQLRAGEANEQAWTFAFGGIIVGLGFLFAGDANKSASVTEVSAIKDVIAQVPHAIASGDTTFLTKTIGQTKPPEPESNP